MRRRLRSDSLSPYADYDTPQIVMLPLIKAPFNKGSHREPQRQRGPFWTPITPLTGSFFHAETQLGTLTSAGRSK
jgi:hypothetical protein